MVSLYDYLVQIIGSPNTPEQELVVYACAGCLVLLFVYNVVRLMVYALGLGGRK